MSSRYDDRDYGRYDREDERYDRRSEYNYGGSYGERPRRTYGSPGRGRETDRERFGRSRDYDLTPNYEDYDRESEYGTRGGKAGFPREFDRSGGGEPLFNTGRAFGGRLYGSSAGLDTFDDETSSYREPSRRSYAESSRSYREPSRRYSQKYNYPSGYRSGGTYGASFERGSEFDRDYDRSERGERDWWDRASDEVSSWFGDEEAERRRRFDKMREGNYRGRGPRGYRRSDERIKEDINDRLSDDSYIDASDIEVMVANCEVTLTGTVDDRSAKRRAEDIAEQVSGVANVENRLRVRGRSATESRSLSSTGSLSSVGSQSSTESTGSLSSTGSAGAPSSTTEATQPTAGSRTAAAGASSSGTSNTGTSTSDRNRTTT